MHACVVSASVSYSYSAVRPIGSQRGETCSCLQTFMEFHSVPKRDGDLAVPGALFALVLDRSFCRPDPGWQRRPGGRPHDSIKPLAAHGFDPARTIIIDDSLRKILPDEHGSAIIVPEYVTAADPACASEPHDTPLPVREPDGTEDPLTIPCQMPVLRVLACLLLHHVRGVDGDIRPALEHVRADLEQVRVCGRRTLKRHGTLGTLCWGA